MNIAGFSASSNGIVAVSWAVLLAAMGSIGWNVLAGSVLSRGWTSLPSPQPATEAR